MRREIVNHSNTDEVRRQNYRECARLLLIRYLNANNHAKKPLDDDECLPSVEELDAENADGIYYLFYVRGSFWGIMLTRQEESKRIIKANPDRLMDPELFVMDLRKAARVNLRNSAFRK